MQNVSENSKKVLKRVCRRKRQGDKRAARGRLFLFCLWFWAAVLAGCRIVDVSKGEVREVEYTVLGSDEIPEEVEKVLDEQGEEPFALAYESGGFLYLMKGYGRQNSGGYSIRVESLYTAGEVIHVQTTLEGPATREEQKGDGSCPTIVLKLEARENASVVFEG